MSDATTKIELLAPAGSPLVLRSAIGAGADAVYFGLKELNARIGAENFNQENLAENVRFVHEHNAKAYLTLNIDISQRELGQAARQLELARQCKVDAMLVKDPAVLKLMPCFPELDFHFSTQAGISSSAGVKAAKELGIKRGVLGRELSIGEIRSASSVEGIETEVFIQGALCFSISGRCLISSWLGGRSGNRGLCASPCRFLWGVGEGKAGRFLSMHDLSLLEKIEDLKAAGVKALKIEGRLKSPEWVAKAVGVYRRAIDNGVDDSLRKEVLALGEYTGRSLTSGYLDGCRKCLTGESGRIAKFAGEPEAEGMKKSEISEDDLVYHLEVKEAGGKLIWLFRYRDLTREVSLPLSIIRNEKRAIPLKEIGDSFSLVPVQGLMLGSFSAHDDAMIVPKSMLGKVSTELSSFLHFAKKDPETKVRINLSGGVLDILNIKPPVNNETNCRNLGASPDTVRIFGLEKACEFHGKYPGARLILDRMDSAGVLRFTAENKSCSPVVALPPVFYEGDIPEIEKLISVCAEEGLTVEVNSWDGWYLAKSAGVKMEAGIGLMVLNSIAADFLNEKGCRAITLSMESDSGQIADICEKCSVPLTLYVYSRPVLMISRAELADEMYGGVFHDRRKSEMKLGREWKLTVFRPVQPFDLRSVRDEKIRVASVGADLSGSRNPCADWISNAGPASFNFFRKLR
ncbi:MAG: U32 family peptidase [Lentisphaerae bacterium]|nr:U32 family peptidase [Lentisphaerota bacterium]